MRAVLPEGANMDSNGIRTFIAILLSMAVLFAWQMWFAPKPKVQQRPDASVLSVAERPDGGTASAQELPQREIARQESADGGQAATPQPRIRVAAPERTYAVDTSLWTAEFSDRGGALKSFKLKKYSVATNDPAPVDLINTMAEGSEAGLPLSVEFGRAPFDIGPSESYEMTARTSDSITFTWNGPAARIEKRFTFKDGEYFVRLETTLKNLSTQKTVLKPVLNWFDKAENVTQSSSWFAPSAPEDFRQPACLVNDAVERADMSKAPYDKSFEGKLEWAGSDSRYFLAAVMPEVVGRQSCSLWADPTGRFRTSVMYPDTELDPGSEKKISYKIFIGPKDHGLLKTFNSGLDRSVDFGWLSVLCIPMLWLLRFFKTMLGNWGVAIILLTILIKVLSLPLTQKSYKSMAEMAKLKPKMDELQKKYKDDRQRLNEEMLKMYKEHEISPLSGCLPMLLQMPIWIALYRMLYSAVELYQQPFIPGWISNLAEKDPFYILPILMGVGMFLQQKLTPTAMDSSQAKVMLYFMPIFFTLIMLSLPAGLTLYIFVNTVLSIAHQLYNNKNNPRAGNVQAVSQT
jgi:YidC/Oxa1 family membrane protein insertase